MPLSKARDRVRKRKERAKVRLEKLLCPPQTLNPVQPKTVFGMPIRIVEGLNDWGLVCNEAIRVDADGNPMPNV